MRTIYTAKDFQELVEAMDEYKIRQAVEESNRTLSKDEQKRFALTVKEIIRVLGNCTVCFNMQELALAESYLEKHTAVYYQNKPTHEDIASFIAKAGNPTVVNEIWEEAADAYDYDADIDCIESIFVNCFEAKVRGIPFNSKGYACRVKQHDMYAAKKNAKKYLIVEDNNSWDTLQVSEDKKDPFTELEDLDELMDSVKALKEINERLIQEGLDLIGLIYDALDKKGMASSVSARRIKRYTDKYTVLSKHLGIILGSGKDFKELFPR